MINDVQVHELPDHSPLGASSAERWMNCPGSVALLKTLELPATDEPEYRTQGTAAHEAAAECLRTGADAWEVVGQKFGDVECDTEMAEAVQVFIDTCRPMLAIPEAKFYIERKMSSRAHPLMFGTVDFAAATQSLLNINDYKHGIGVVVEVEDNPQLKYYAYLVLQDHPEVRRVVLRVVQPRAFHPDGPVRRWETTAEDIVSWVHAQLIPAMNVTQIDSDFMAGDWCRFCPAKLVCPVLTGLFGAAVHASKDAVKEMTDPILGLTYQQVFGVKQYIKALEEETFRRLNLGHEVTGTKLVHKKANRVWRDGAVAVMKGAFGPLALTEPELKTPAQMEKVDPQAPTMVKEWAYTPESGLTVALADDKRPAVKTVSAGETFAHVDIPTAVE